MINNNETLRDAGLKVTHPRTKILDVLQANPDMHLSADEIHNKLVEHNESIGLATVYRVLTQLEIAGLIQKNQFSDNQSSYEIKKQQEKATFKFRYWPFMADIFYCKNHSVDPTIYF